MKCGAIFCGGGGGESITGKRAVFTVDRVECNVPVDDDKTRSLNLVPNGTRCGPNKVRRSAETRPSLSAVLLRTHRLCSGLPPLQMCGCIRLRDEGGMCAKMQRPRGEPLIFMFGITRSSQFKCKRLTVTCFILRCAITRRRVTAILAGLHRTATRCTQIYLKVHDSYLELISGQSNAFSRSRLFSSQRETSRLSSGSGGKMISSHRELTVTRCWDAFTSDCATLHFLQLTARNTKKRRERAGRVCETHFFTRTNARAHESFSSHC